MSIEILKDLRLGKIDYYFHNKGYKEYVECRRISDIDLPTGSIVVADPICMDGYEALNKKVKPGKYPVYLYLHYINQEAWVAFAEIRFAEQVPYAFKEAYTFTNKKVKIKKNEEVGYITSNHLMSFMDEKLANYLMGLNEKAKSYIWDQWDNILEMNQTSQYTTLNSVMDDGNVVAFSSGYKDGIYGAYWGVDMMGKACSLIIDFRTLLGPEDIQNSIDWGRSYDRGVTHNSKIKEKNLPLDPLAGYNHMAAFLKWMINHQLMSPAVIALYPDLLTTTEDLREVIDQHPIFKGSLKRGHFSPQGQAFANGFYLFRMQDESGYPRCTDIHAENYFGLEKYNSEEFQDEAYLFVPYDESYYERMFVFIDKAWQRFMEEEKEEE